MGEVALSTESEFRGGAIFRFWTSCIMFGPLLWGFWKSIQCKSRCRGQRGVLRAVRAVLLISITSDGPRHRYWVQFFLYIHQLASNKNLDEHLTSDDNLDDPSDLQPKRWSMVMRTD